MRLFFIIINNKRSKTFKMIFEKISILFVIVSMVCCEEQNLHISDASNHSMSLITETLQFSGEEVQFFQSPQEIVLTEAIKELTECLNEVIYEENDSENNTVEGDCVKAQQAQECYTTTARIYKSNLTETEITNINKMYRNIYILIKCICSKRGKRITDFNAGGGPACMETNRQALTTFANESVDPVWRLKINAVNVTNNFTVNWLYGVYGLYGMAALYGKERCTKFVLMGVRTRGALRLCEQPAAANFVGFLHDTVWKLSPCNSMCACSCTCTSYRQAKPTVPTVKDDDEPMTEDPCDELSALSTLTLDDVLVSPTSSAPTTATGGKDDTSDRPRDHGAAKSTAMALLP